MAHSAVQGHCSDGSESKVKKKKKKMPLIYKCMAYTETDIFGQSERWDRSFGNILYLFIFFMFHCRIAWDAELCDGFFIKAHISADWISPTTPVQV